MKYINLVYEDDILDVDILSVPNEVADNIESIVKEFEAWCGIPENARRFMIYNDQGAYMSVDTEEFLWWLSEVKLQGREKAVIVKQHTTICYDYPCAEF
jgi:hypothetical protein